MKTLLTAMTMVLGAFVATAEEFRMWTEAATKRQIEAKLKDKDDEAGTVTLLLKSMKTVELAVSKLVAEDQKYVKEWEEELRPEDQLTVRVVASGSARGKRVEVDVEAGPTDVVVKGGCDSGCHRLEKTVKAKERGLFQIEVHDKYTFTLTDANGVILDEETALKKTGNTRSR